MAQAHAARPCVRHLLRSTAMPSPPVSLLGEQVAETQRVRQVQQRHHVPHTGTTQALPPAPHGLGMGPQAPVYLRPRQARLLLEALEALREVIGKAPDSSAVMSALSRHRAGPSCVGLGPLLLRERPAARPTRLDA